MRLDIDRDGFSDIGVVNANAPFFNLYRNRLGDGNTPNHFIAVRFKGGNRLANSSSQWSARDGYVATVRLQMGDRVLLREHRAGEGFAGQNSKTMLIGLGQHDVVPSIQVRWPSGKTQDIPTVSAGSLITLYENPGELQNDVGYVIGDYRTPRPAATARVEAKLKLPIRVDTKAKISVYVTMATWCQQCGKEFASLKRTLSQLGPGTVAAFGVPIDPSDTKSKLEEWKARHNPAIPVLDDLTEAQREGLRELLNQRTNLGVLVPTTIISDQNGAILDVIPGPPSLSQIREFLDS